MRVRLATPYLSCSEVHHTSVNPGCKRSDILVSLIVELVERCAMEEASTYTLDRTDLLLRSIMSAMR